MKPENHTPSGKRVIQYLTDEEPEESFSLSEKDRLKSLVRHSSNLTIDKESAWNNIHSAINEQSQVKSRKLFFNYGSIAAAVVLLILAAVVSYKLTDDAEQSVSYFTEDAKKTVTLPDGSVVIMNSNTRMELDHQFNDKNRSVKLTGEAHFSVKKHPKNLEFNISTDHGSVTVLGTKFNVNTINNTKVYVSEGTVAINSANSDTPVELNKGNLGIISLTGELLTEAGSDNVLYWNTRQMNFDNKRLADVVDTVNKYLGADIQLAEDIKDCRITLGFEGSKTDDFINELKKIKEIFVSGENDSLLISGEGC